MKTKLCDVNPAAKDKLPHLTDDKSGVGAHYVDAYLKPMNVKLNDGTAVRCKRRGLKITLTIEKSGGPIVKTKTIDLINPGDEKTVTFTQLGQVPFAQKTNVKVDVQPVPGEKTTSNNSGTYPVIFSLG